MNRRNLLLCLTLAATLAFSVCLPTCLARSWTSKDGKFKTEAELLGAT